MPPTISFRSPPGHTDLASVMPAPAGSMPGANTPYPSYIRPLDLQFTDPRGFWYRVHVCRPFDNVLPTIHRQERRA